MENHIDKLFNKKLRNDETAYDPAAWGRMADLIDNEEDMNGGGVSPPRTSHWKKYITLALLLLITLVGFWQLKWDADEKVAFNTSVNDKESWDAINSENTTLRLNAMDQETRAVGANTEHAIGQISHEGAVHTKGITNDNTRSAINLSSSNQPKDIQENLPIERLSNNREAEQSLEISQERPTGNESKSLTYNNTESIHVETEDIIQSIGNVVSQSTLNNGFQNTGIDATEARKETESDFEYAEKTNAQGIKSKYEKEQATDYLNQNILGQVSPTAVSDRIRDEISMFPFLRTSTQNLRADYKEIVPAMTAVQKTGRWSMGLYSTLAVNEGFIFQNGLRLNYRINPAWSVSSGVGLDYAEYSNGPLLTVTDKVYSFGSTFTDRSLILDKSAGLNIPMVLNRRFDKILLFAGLDINYHLAGHGTTDDGEGNETSFWIADDVFNRFMMHYQFGIAYTLSRQLRIQLGVTNRSSVFTKEVTSSNDNGKILPTIGFNYLITRY